MQKSIKKFDSMLKKNGLVRKSLVQLSEYSSITVTGFRKRKTGQCDRKSH